MRTLLILLIAAALMLVACTAAIEPTAVPTDVPATEAPAVAVVEEAEVEKEVEEVEEAKQEEMGKPAVIADNTPYKTDDERPGRFHMASSWKTDWSINNIDYDDILSGGPPRDGIPSIDDPAFEGYESADQWLANREPIIALDLNGDARAYPLGVLTRHEIVNDTVGGIPIIATFCPLCNSAIVFDRRVGDETFEFGVSGLLRNSDMIMYDRTTESLWQQFTGEGVVGELTGTQLTFLPSQIISYADFKAAYPDGKVLSPVRGTGTNPYTGYDTPGNRPFLFNGKLDPRLDAVARVVTLSFDEGLDVAYPVDILAEVRVINDRQGTHDLVVFWTPGTASALGASQIAQAADVGATGVYDPILDGQKLTFVAQGDQIVDEQTGSVWDITGRATAGDFAGQRLTPVIHADHFWFSWAAFRPDTILYGQE